MEFYKCKDLGDQKYLKKKVIYELLVPIVELVVPMKALSQKESEALVLLFKDFSKSYNANSISSLLNITSRGALKILKNLRERNMVVGKTLGNATFYKINFEDSYTIKTVETLLMQEAKENAQRWVSELRELFEVVEGIILFGSMVRSPKKANDIDIVIIVSQKNFERVKELVESKNQTLLKPIHPVYQSLKDFENNMEKEDPVIINALRRGYVLHGHEKIVGMVKNVTGFK